jgi:hypothetical protein
VPFDQVFAVVRLDFGCYTSQGYGEVKVVPVHSDMLFFLETTPGVHRLENENWAADWAADTMHDSSAA